MFFRRLRESADNKTLKAVLEYLTEVGFPYCIAIISTAQFLQTALECLQFIFLVLSRVSQQFWFPFFRAISRQPSDHTRRRCSSLLAQQQSGYLPKRAST